MLNNKKRKNTQTKQQKTIFTTDKKVYLDGTQFETYQANQARKKQNKSKKKVPYRKLWESDIEDDSSSQSEKSIKPNKNKSHSKFQSSKRTKNSSKSSKQEIQQQSKEKKISKFKTQIKEMSFSRLRNQQIQKLKKKYNKMDAQQNYIIPQIMSAFDETVINPKLMVQYNQNFKQIRGQDLLGQGNIFQGYSSSGKRSAVHYIVHKANQKQKSFQIIQINSLIYQTDLQFLYKLSQRISKVVDLPFKKDITVSQQIELRELNPYIKKAKKKIIIVVRYAENLVKIKKQILLYNLLEWVKTDVKQLVGVIFTTRMMNLLQKFQKRVKSRFNGRTYFFFYPQTKDIIQIMRKRVGQINLNNDNLKADILNAISMSNKSMKDQIQNTMIGPPRGIDGYLKLFKLVFGFYTEKELKDSNRQQLAMDIPLKFQMCLSYIAPYRTQINPMIQNCSIPEMILLAVMRNMIQNQRYPLKLQSIFTVYNEQKKKYLDTGISSKSIAVSFHREITQKTAKKLKDNGLIIMNDFKQNFWNQQIVLKVYPDTIRQSIKGVRNIPDFLHNILDD